MRDFKWILGLIPAMMLVSSTGLADGKLDKAARGETEAYRPVYKVDKKNNTVSFYAAKTDKVPAEIGNKTDMSKLSKEEQVRVNNELENSLVLIGEEKLDEFQADFAATKGIGGKLDQGKTTEACGCWFRGWGWGWGWARSWWWGGWGWGGWWW